MTWLANLWGALKSLGAIADAIGKLADWFREWQAERRAEEAAAAKERERGRRQADATTDAITEINDAQREIDGRDRGGAGDVLDRLRARAGQDGGSDRKP